MMPGWNVSVTLPTSTPTRCRECSLAPDEEDITTIDAVVVGAACEGGFFHLLVKCTKEYPMSPPKVRFMTSDEGRVQFNPHIWPNSGICLSLLGTMDGPTWTPAYSLSSVAVSIQSMLDESVGNVDGALAALEHIILGFWNPGAAKATHYETLRVACLQYHRVLPRRQLPVPAISAGPAARQLHGQLLNV
ncbi:ubiquitin-conjugating enzyme E2 Z-like [Dermacentor silvarum]|uniref:ubiquitin-conjugating enzyme E2 Z-like n=1 Tax=Dermacentor silvarum TaxID=543639 RepID=UPI00189802EE|nr:ubiquitin-conjugating enzyme E2 Z-like [Dermacentor silvarum]